MTAPALPGPPFQAIPHCQTNNATESLTSRAEMLCVGDGWATLTTNTQTLHLNPGHVVFIPQGLTTSITPHGFMHAIAVRITPPALDGITALVPEPSPLPGYFTRLQRNPHQLGHLHLAAPAMRTVIAQLRALQHTQSLQQHPFADLATLTSTLATIERNIDNTPRRESPQTLQRTPSPEIARATALLHRNLATPWTISALARAVGLSQSQLQRLFKTQLHTTPVAYLRHQRVDRIAELLASTSLTVGQAARKVGLKNPATTSRAFQQRYGISPSKYAGTILSPSLPNPTVSPHFGDALEATQPQ